MASVTSVEIERFRAVVARRLGLFFDEAKTSLLAQALERSASSKETPGAYLDRLERDGARDELRILARDLTVSETYFFRHREQLRAFAEVALPERIAAQAGTRTLRLVSAGCATGEEPYSLAIAVRELGLPAGWDVSIRAFDVNPLALERAERGVYTEWSLRETPPEVRRRWFSALKPGFEIDPLVKGTVRFEEHNLAEASSVAWGFELQDVVFCRNVLMYFTVDASRALVERIASALAPGGYLFIGHAETLRGLSDDFELCDSHGTFYYRRKGAPIASRDPRPFSPSTLSLGAVEGSTGWIEAVQRAAERIQSLEQASTAAARLAPLSETDVKPILECLDSERFAEALDRIERLPPDRASEPLTRLLRAVSLVHSGRLEAAEQAGRDLLAHDAYRARARYVLALCRDGAGDRHAAMEHDRIAVHLDPTFAMPRLHLGLMARRAGDRETARRELEKASDLLANEDPSRVTLFGGGFGRTGLLALCRAELLALGSRRS